MTRSQQVREQRYLVITSTANQPPVGINFDENVSTDENQTSTISDEENEDNTDNTTSDTKELKSNVWRYARKLSPNEAQCLKCKIKVRTNHGATTTLRKHLIIKHHLVELSSRLSSRKINKHSINHEKKRRLDHLANLAIFEDGRSFGDFRKSGIKRFLDEAIPGNLVHLNLPVVEPKNRSRVLSISIPFSSPITILQGSPQKNDSLGHPCRKLAEINRNMKKFLGEISAETPKTSSKK